MNASKTWPVAMLMASSVVTMLGIGGQIEAQASASSCSQPLRSELSGNPNRVALAWLMDSQPNFEPMHLEFLRLLEHPILPSFTMSRVLPISSMTLGAAKAEIVRALSYLESSDDPELLMYLDGHGNADGTTPLFGCDFPNVCILQHVLEPALDFVKGGRKLTLNIVCNTCYSGLYTLEVQNYIHSKKADPRLNINILTAVGPDIKALGNQLMNRIEVAQAILHNAGPQTRLICPTCSEFQKIAIVADRIGWAYHTFPDELRGRGPLVWSSQHVYADFEIHELVAILGGIHRQLATIVQENESPADKNQFEGWLNMYVLVAKLVLQKNSIGEARIASRAAIAQAIERHLPAVLRAEDFYSGARLPVWRRWSTLLRDLIAAAGSASHQMPSSSEYPSQ